MREGAQRDCRHLDCANSSAYSLLSCMPCGAHQSEIDVLNSEILAQRRRRCRHVLVSMHHASKMLQQARGSIYEVAITASLQVTLVAVPLRNVWLRIAVPSSPDPAVVPRPRLWRRGHAPAPPACGAARARSAAAATACPRRNLWLCAPPWPACRCVNRQMWLRSLWLCLQIVSGSQHKRSRAIAPGDTAGVRKLAVQLKPGFHLPMVANA